MHDLEGDLVARLEAGPAVDHLRQVDTAHSARAQVAVDLVRAESLSDEPVIRHWRTDSSESSQRQRSSARRLSNVGQFGRTLK